MMTNRMKRSNGGHVTSAYATPRSPVGLSGSNAVSASIADPEMAGRPSSLSGGMDMAAASGSAEDELPAAVSRSGAASPSFEFTVAAACCCCCCCCCCTFSLRGATGTRPALLVEADARKAARPQQCPDSPPPAPHGSRPPSAAASSTFLPSPPAVRSPPPSTGSPLLLGPRNTRSRRLSEGVRDFGRQLMMVVAKLCVRFAVTFLISLIRTFLRLWRNRNRRNIGSDVGRGAQQAARFLASLPATSSSPSQAAPRSRPPHGQINGSEQQRRWRRQQWWWRQPCRPTACPQKGQAGAAITVARLWWHGSIARSDRPRVTRGSSISSDATYRSTSSVRASIHCHQ